MKRRRRHTAKTDIHNEGVRKAAILLAGLDRASAETMLATFPPQQAKTIRRKMADLGAIDPKEQRRVIDEFFRSNSKTPQQPVPGVELHGALVDMQPASQAAALTSRLPGARPFRFLHETEADKLSRLLRGERPQTIALVLSHLPPERSGKVLSRLPGTIQVEVVHRLIDLEETDPEILRDVETALQSRLAEQVQMQRRRVAGMKAVTGILQAADDRTGAEILSNLSRHDRPLAEKLSPPEKTPSLPAPEIGFDDLWKLADGELSAVLAAAGAELTMTALVGARPEMIDRVLKELPASEAQVVRRRLDHPGPIRLSDVEAARKQIAQEARHLFVKGSTPMPHQQPVPVS